MSLTRSRLAGAFSVVFFTLVACGSDDPGSSSGTSGSSSGDADGGKTSSTSSSSSSSSSSSTSGGDAGPKPGSCQNFGFGTSPIHGDALFDKCDMFPPRNCKTGGYIWFDDSKKADTCFCRVDCDDFNPAKKPGEACAPDVLCTSVKNQGGSSTGDTCLPKGWQALNLCK